MVPPRRRRPASRGHRAGGYLAESRDWLAELAGLRDEVRVVDVIDELCDDRTCPARSDGLVNYIDGTHLSRSRVRLLSPYFDDVFARLDQ